MKELVVYLAGPIEGLTYEEATGWRKDVRERLAPKSNITIIDPMTGKGHLKGRGAITAYMAARQERYTSMDDTVFYRDAFSVRRCDILLVNMMEKSSTGTTFEMGLAYGEKKLILTVNAGARSYHPFVKIPSVLLDSMDDAIDMIKGLA